MGKKKVGCRQFRRIINRVVETEIKDLNGAVDEQQEHRNSSLHGTYTDEKNCDNCQNSDNPRTSFGHGICDLPIQLSGTQYVSSLESSYTTDEEFSNVSSDEDFEREFKEDVFEPSENLQDELKLWAVEESITHQALSKLLVVLRQYLPNLPKSSKTLLKTPSSAPVQDLSTSGEILYLGIEENIQRRLKKETQFTSTAITLHFFIDGIPISDSSNKCFWPILVRILECQDNTPFPIQIYLGNSKPKSLSEYFEAFTAELKCIIECGLTFNGTKLSVSPDKCLFICDAPARSFIKSVKGHAGYFGCEKCEMEGEWQNKVVYSATTSSLRTDLSFRDRTQEEHHVHPYILEKSPLENLGIGMISRIPLDYMHLICLGGVRKIISLWISGPLHIRLQSSQVKCVSKRLSELRDYIPSEFQRKPRDLECFTRWKATECRLFLLYLGPVVLKSILKKEVYQNFMLLSVATRLLLQKDSRMYSVARDLLQEFVKHYKMLYGQVNMVYNIHNLLHIADDAILHGNLDSFSAFPFENYLGKMKRKLRSGNKPLQQIYCRMQEEESIQQTKKPETFPRLQIRSLLGPTMGIPNGVQFRKCLGENFVLAANEKDSYCRTKLGECVKIISFVEKGGKIWAVVKKLLHIDHFFKYPFPSSDIQIQVAKIASEKLFCIDYSDIAQKLMCIPTDYSRYVIIPLLHS